MSMDEIIRHEGVVLSTDGKMAHVAIVQASACQACKAQSMCLSSENQQKEMDVIMLEPMQAGDRVEVQVQEHLAWKAVFLAYILPFVIMMIMMLLLLRFTPWGESIIGGISLGSIALYYLLLALFKHRLRKYFTFTARKL